MSLEELSPEKRAVYVERLRAMTPEKRFQLAIATIARGKAFMLADIRSRHPHASGRELQRLLAERMCGAEIAERAYGRRK